MTVSPAHHFKPGNELAKKLVSDEMKREAYKQYCEHIAKGYPRKAWRFRHPDVSITWNTIEKYIKEEPEVFDPIKKEVAAADSLQYWFSYLADSAKGENQKANVASLQIILRNMHAWDAKDPQQQHSDNNFAQAQEIVLKQLTELQNKSKSPSVCEDSEECSE